MEVERPSLSVSVVSVSPNPVEIDETVAVKLQVNPSPREEDEIKIQMIYNIDVVTTKKCLDIPSLSVTREPNEEGKDSNVLVNLQLRKGEKSEFPHPAELLNNMGMLSIITQIQGGRVVTNLMVVVSRSEDQTKLMVHFLYPNSNGVAPSK
eukprot:TRINITY_DN13602_c0_g1_i5.p1 TRINITY_DN13602_c0_g1~~TRINITY_DN13602_c0_g1_i5.p1  ORF type:complete len:151 (-),score=27.42 TRINITY_DN13602_c0_g1_i5:109-561(-)